MKAASLLAMSMALVAVVSGCGGEPSARTDAPASAASVGVYFLADRSRYPVVVTRTVDTDPSIAQSALEALLAGPSRSERASGLTSALPPGTELVSFRVERGTATASFSGLGPPRSGVQTMRVVTQVVRTLTGLSGVERVRFEEGGRPWGLWDTRSRVRGGPYAADTLPYAVGSTKAGSETAPDDCFEPFGPNEPPCERG